jgi:hypothetical protein
MIATVHRNELFDTVTKPLKQTSIVQPHRAACGAFMFGWHRHFGSVF